MSKKSRDERLQERYNQSQDQGEEPSYSSEEGFECDVCGAEFDTERGLKSHTGQVHETIDDDEHVRLQLRVPRGTRDEFNGLAQSKLELEMNERGHGKMFDELSKPELQNAAIQVVVNNIDEWADEIEQLHE
ncbi:hypothetical protein [Halorubrum halodurans]|uniref:hypothetical protein n=1 Tax=Halorubrum halodurans TaxID=1383851 RepID=UPI00117A1A06|nr:hypothetical protein [Halorubrum halodurans]